MEKFFFSTMCCAWVGHAPQQQEAGARDKEMTMQRCIIRRIQGARQHLNVHLQAVFKKACISETVLLICSLLGLFVFKILKCHSRLPEQLAQPFPNKIINANKMSYCMLYYPSSCITW